MEEEEKEGKEMVDVLLSTFEPIVRDARSVVCELRKLLGTGVFTRSTLGLEDRDIVVPLLLGAPGSGPPAGRPTLRADGPITSTSTAPPAFASPPPLAGVSHQSTPSTSIPVLHSTGLPISMDDLGSRISTPLSNVRTTGEGQMASATEVGVVMRLEVKKLVAIRVQA